MFNKNRSNDLFDVAVKLHGEGKFVEAVAAYREAISADPTDSNTYYWMGGALSGAKQYGDAIEAFQQAIRLNPRNHWATIELASTYCMAREWDRAREAYQVAEAKAADSTEKYNTALGMGYMFLQQRLYEEAVKVLEQARHLYAVDPQVHSCLGSAYAGLTDFDKAEASFRRAVRLDGSYVYGVSGLSWVMAKLGRDAEAEAMLDEHLSNQPENPVLLRAKIAVLYVSGRHEEAVEVGKQLLEIEPDNAGVHSDIAESLVKLGRDDEAWPYFENAYKIDPRPMIGISHYGLGLIAQRDGDTEKAIKRFRACLEIESDHAGALRGLAELGAEPT